jgi:predicted nucleic acid-binding protein
VRYLLDTCVLSDPTQRRPNAGVKDWYARTPETNMYVSVLSIGEIRKGLVKLAGTPKAARIGAWLDHELLQRFDQRLLGVDIDVCNLWGTLCGELLQRGCPSPVTDSLIAATALTHELTLVTRNVKDFRNFDIAVINPWQ